MLFNNESASKSRMKGTGTRCCWPKNNNGPFASAEHSSWLYATTSNCFRIFERI